MMSECVFCHRIEPKDRLAESNHFFAVLDINPIQNGHILIISKQHYMNMRDIPEIILKDLICFEQKIIAILEDAFNVLGVSIIQNNGKVMDLGTHFHVHLIPRYHEDQFWDHQKVVQFDLAIDCLKKQLKNVE